MSNRRVSTATAAVLTGTIVLTAGAAAPAQAAETNTPLAITSFGDMLVDSVHQRVFISDPAGGKVLATDYRGQQIGAVDVAGADDLALSADASRLYVGSPGDSAIFALDAGTLERTAKYSTGAVAPADVVAAGGRIWFSYADDGGRLGTIDPSTETVRLDLSGTGSAAAELATASARTGRIGLAAKGRTAVIDVSGDTVTEVASADTTADIVDVSLNPDGTRIATVSAAQIAVTLRDVSDFAVLSTNKPLAGRPLSVDLAAGGALASTSDGSRMYVYAPHGGVIRQIELETRGEGVAHGVEWAPNEDRLFVVSENRGAYTLLTEKDSQRAHTFVSNFATADVVPGGSVTFTGTLTSQLPLPAGSVVEVTRGGTSLGGFPVGSDRSFTFTDNPPGTTGEVGYQISYGGSEFHLPAPGSASARIIRAEVSSSFGAPDTALPGTPVRISGQLTTRSPMPWPTGAAVEISRNGTVVGTAPIDADGYVTFTDNPPGEGVMTYRFAYAGDTVRRVWEREFRVEVSRRVSTITLAGPLTATRGEALTLTGTLTSPLELPAGTTVAVSRTDPESPAGKPLGTRTVAADGSFGITDAPPSGGTVTYRVTYTGDAAHTPASAVWAVTVPRAKPALTITNNGKIYEYGQTVTFTAKLGTTYKNRAVEIWADPAGDDLPRRLVKRATVNSKGVFSANLKLTRDVIVTAVFTGDARTAPRTVHAMVGTKVNIGLKLSSYYKSGKISGKTYRYYRPGKTAYFRPSMTRAASRQVNIVLQRYSGGTWKTMQNVYFEADESLYMQGNGLKGVKLRVKAGYVAGASGDALNHTTWTPYQYLIFK
ncbi:MAG TPA: hypothetical protein VN408_08785 [Actinoplanes sp.]|nr:hypothetical protein [Actinoplanes sp.]